MALEIISKSIYKKVWDRAGIDLAIPGSAVTTCLRLRFADR